MKLTDMARVAGLTAGAEVMAKTARPQDITFDPDLDIFNINDELVETIAQAMREKGYDKSQPVVVWKGRGCVVDGRTRLKAALAAELPELPVVEKEFDSLEEAIQYAYRRQAERRNLSQGEILEAAIRLGIKERRDGTGKGREKLAKDLGVSESTIKRARTVAKRGSDDDLKAIKKGEKTINQVYQGLREKEPKETPPSDPGEEGSAGIQASVSAPPPAPSPEDPMESESFMDPLEGGESPISESEIEDGGNMSLGIDADNGEEGKEEDGGTEAPEGGGKSIPAGEQTETGESGYGADGWAGAAEEEEKIKFLRASIILLCEKGYVEAAALMIRHFVRRKNIFEFTRMLPKETKSVIDQGLAGDDNGN
jgi:ParB family chromosome partitioning protein